MTASPGSAHPRHATHRSRARLLAGCMFILGALALASGNAYADATLNPALLPAIQGATFEVVAAKPKDTLTYEKPLPLDLLPYQERTDKYYSIGTAFAIGPNTYVTAGHVLMAGYESLWGPPELRDASGKVYAIDKIEKFALRRDFVVFSLKYPPKITPLPVDTKPALNQVVYSVGNALGTGVVIRNGLYTSDTPEAQDGQWKWIRFSAAASPGNSGGPLLDQNGKVIGVVLMKSPNENLNYALPMADVLGAQADLARYDRRVSYQFDAFDATLSGTFKGQFQLPLPLATFFADYAKAFHPWLDGQLHALLASQAATLFPHGAGAHEVLYGGPEMGDFPQLLVRNSNGVWGTTGRARLKISLPANGYIEAGTLGNTIAFHLRKPDTLAEHAFVNNPAQVMDLLLKTGMLKRRVGSEAVQVTSFGQPTSTAAWTDHWGRKWQVWIWPIPYANSYQTMFALPTPDGYAILTRLNSAGTSHDTVINLRALTDFISLPYDGTLAQWHDFLQQGALLPAAFKDLHIDFAYGQHFSYASPRVALAFTPALQKISADSMLTLGFGFFPDQDGKVVWDVAQVWLAQDSQDHHWLSLRRIDAPPADLDDSYQARWKKVLNRQHPFDAMAYSENDTTKIDTVVPPPRGGAAKVLYTAYVYQPGTQPQAEMKAKLELLLKGVKVMEQ